MFPIHGLNTATPLQSQVGSYHAELTPRAFSGATPWEAYATHFNEVRKLNRWTDEVVGHQLIVAMEAEALLFVDTISEEVNEVNEDYYTVGYAHTKPYRIVATSETSNKYYIV